MPLYRLTVREIREREVVVEATSRRAAWKTRPSEWQDAMDRGTLVDSSIEDVDGPDTESEVDCMTEWKVRAEG